MNYSLTQEQVKRLNILKLVFALFVVYIHINQSDVRFSNEIMQLQTPKWLEVIKYTFSEVVPRVAVEGFFLMSSIFLYKKEFSWIDNIRKKIKSLLFPYFIMNTFWIVVFAICQKIPQTQIFFRDQNNIIANFTFWRWLQAYGIGDRYPFLYPLWFIRNLFILNLLSTILKKAIDMAPKVFAVLLVMAFLFLNTTKTYYLEITDLCIWCLGYYLVYYKVNIDYFDEKKIISVIYPLLCLLTIILRNQYIFIITTLLIRLRTIFGIIFWYSVFTKKVKGGFKESLLKYSKYNFGIYIFHEMTLSFTIKLVALIFGTGICVQILQYLFQPLCICGISIVVCMLMNRFAPHLFRLLTGSRMQ